MTKTIKRKTKIRKIRRAKMNNFITYLFIIFMAIFGGFSTLYVVVSLPVTIIYKIFRRIKFGEKIL